MQSTTQKILKQFTQPTGWIRIVKNCVNTESKLE